MKSPRAVLAVLLVALAVFPVSSLTNNQCSASSSSRLAPWFSTASTTPINNKRMSVATTTTSFRTTTVVLPLKSRAASGDESVEPMRSDNVSRASFLSSVSTAVGLIMMTTLSAPPAQAASTDPSIKGTKKDPVFEACLSQCMYDCTKPKGEEQKSRAECLPDCKKKCATTKAQLLKGNPIPSAN